MEVKEHRLRVQWTQVVSRHNPLPVHLAAIALALGLAAAPSSAQNRQSSDWRPVGNTLQLLDLPSPAGGAAERVWFAGDPAVLYVRLPGARVFATSDLDNWIPATAEPPAVERRLSTVSGAPEPGLLLEAEAGGPRYVAGSDLWRSQKGGREWRNLTRWRNVQILGGPVLDAAVAPGNEDRIAVATSTGIWLSHDGGLTWTGLNENLSNLPVQRILAAPAGTRGMRIVVDAGDRSREVEWAPGQRTGWIPASGESEPEESVLRRRLGSRLGAPLSAAAASGDAVYAGSADGRLWASTDRGRTWRTFTAPDSSVQKFWLDPSDSRFALAALSGASGKGPRVLRTLNGGVWWDDLTANLPEAAVWGIAADRNSGAVYVATARGLFWTSADLRAPSSASPWSQILGNLPEGAVRDVHLDEAGARLYAAVEYQGVFVTPAPHRTRAPLLVHSADYSDRPAAPGDLLSVIGSGVDTATANRNTVPVLASTPQESQIQVPFEAAGDSLQLVLESSAGRISLGLPLRDAAPAILIDQVGTPVLIDAETGVQLDAMNPARGGMLVQILASGLGRVNPLWPTGLPAPLANPPRVVNSVRVLLDGSPVEVLRATLAPGYIGYYLVEVRLPDFLDAGASELMIDSAGNQSNRVRVYIER